MSLTAGNHNNNVTAYSYDSNLFNWQNKQIKLAWVVLSVYLTIVNVV